MPDPPPQSILCPVLMGRDAQVAALARLWDQHIVVTAPSPCAVASNDGNLSTILAYRGPTCGK